MTDSRPPRRPDAGKPARSSDRSKAPAEEGRGASGGAGGSVWSKRPDAPRDGAKPYGSWRKGAGEERRPQGERPAGTEGGGKPFAKRRPEGGSDGPWKREGEQRFANKRRDDGAPFKPREDRPFKQRTGDAPFKAADERPYKRRDDGASPPREGRPFKPQGDRPFKRRSEEAPSTGGEARPYKRRDDAASPSREGAPFKARGDRPLKRRDEGGAVAGREERPFKRRDPDAPFTPRGDRPFKRRDDGQSPEQGTGGRRRDERSFDRAGERRPRRPAGGGGERGGFRGGDAARGPSRRERKEFKLLPARAQAAIVVRRVLTGRSLTDALAGIQRSTSPEDRALIQELSYGTLRWGYRLQGVVERLLDRPLKADYLDVHALLLIGLYQLLYMRVPAYAAVTETVNAAATLEKDWARGLVNGVLRRFQREQDSLLAAVDETPALRHAYPDWLAERLRQAWPEQWEAILEAGNQRPPMALRVNLGRVGRQAYFGQLLTAALPARPIPEVASGIVLDAPVETDRLPGFADGLVSVQDGGAQLAAALLDAQPGQRVLDACAAPGGKTGHLLERTPDLDLVALDVDGERLERVRENVARLGLEAKLRQGDAARPEGDWAEPGYQRILADVPCSATGVIRRHPDIKWLRRNGDINSLAYSQARILDALWPLLAPGGRMLYMTCSLLPEENERQVEAFLQRTADARTLPIEAKWGVSRGAGRQTLPGENGMDGFFFAVLEKSATP